MPKARFENLFTSVVFTFYLLSSIKGYDNGIYLNKWAVEVKGGPHVASRIAAQHGFRNLGQIGSLRDIYEFEHHAIKKRSLSPTHRHHHKLVRDPVVKWAEQQVAKKRVKRDLDSDHDAAPSVHKADNDMFNDPLWSEMWFLNSGADGGCDMNVAKAWQRGYTGKGVVVTILDDGIEHTHPDLKQNYDPQASNDINGHDKDPMPRYDDRNENKHGTRCAGEVAAVANNSKCVVGVAYNANIGGVRMLDGDVSDLVEASALGHNPQHVDIYSASWGPDDNGKVVEGPAKLARDTFINGILNGRKGKGSIFVWASGNGGSEMDSCACDGYTNSIFTLSVSSLSEHNTKPWYLEECASTLATTYSSGENYRDRKIVTTDLHGECTEQHTGTSASAPLAAGLVALALEANSELTWRDMQYIVLRTANTEPFLDAEWVVNGVGRKVSHRYGYGLMDADRMVREAERWTPVPPQRVCSSSDKKMKHDIDNTGISFKLDTDSCEGTDNHVKFLEHVQAKISLSYYRRGDIQIYLTSPSGTTSVLLPQRKKDHAATDFNDWPFMSVFYWGEDPRGTWTLDIENVGSDFNSGIITKWQLILYGTNTNPVRLKPPMKFPPTKQPVSETVADVTGNHTETGSSDPWRSSSKGTNSPVRVFTTGPSLIGGDEKDTHSGEVDTGIDVVYTNASPTRLPVTTLLTCHEECDEETGCTGPNAFDCIACKNNKLMPDGICVKDCPLQSYFDAEFRTCNMCEIPCLRCSGSDVDSDCLHCIPGYILVEGEGRCVVECPSGFYDYEDTSEHLCRRCAPECAECLNEAGSCTDCQAGYQLDGDQCVVFCGETEYKDSEGRCSPCHPSCYSCYGGGSDHCSRCVDELLFQNGTCVYQCDIGYFEEMSTDGILCRQCHSTCADCVGPGMDDCLACVQPLILLHGSCLETCPYRHFQDSDSSCYPCDVSCTSCTGPHAGDCLGCGEYDFLQDGYCQQSCGEFHFAFESYSADGERVAVCESCHPSCSRCTGPLSSECLQCRSGLFLTQGECQTECAVYEYEENDGRCYLCHGSCLSCFGPAKTDCTSCKDPMLLLAGECLSVCPSGYFQLLQECVLCHHSCATCDGESSVECLECASGFEEHHGLCIESSLIYTITCDSSHYFDEERGACIPCHESCGSCSDSSPKSCLSCTPSGVYYPTNQMCVQCCTADIVTHCCMCITGEDFCSEDNYVGHDHHVSTTYIEPSVHTSTPSTLLSTSYSTSYAEDTHSSTSSTHATRVHISSESPDVQTSAESITTEVDSGIDTNGAERRNWANMLTFLVFACVFIAVVFLVIFGLMQARSNERLCWKSHYYQPVPTLYQNGKPKVMITEIRCEYADDVLNEGDNTEEQDGITYPVS